ncbi:peptidyl-prolyl cis-trans isomerase [Aureococcus anophagefferens]|nr:peptidyl-prolyl cis-trans isomerase [Aureococcus anophagefferens]
MNFSTKRKAKARSWKDVDDAPAKKAKDDGDREHGEEDGECEVDAFGQLKRELAERERIKALRKKELAKAAAIPKRSTHEAGRGRLICELFEDVVPRTAKNFLSLITGEKGDGLELAGTVFHRVEPGVAVTGGDVDRGDGSGGRSIYGRDFEDENHTLKHTNAGVLTMHSRRPNSNNSQFQILLDERPELDGRQVVFGRLVDGFAILREVEKLGTATGAPKELAKIARCGVCKMHATVEETLEAYRTDLVLCKEVTDMKQMARNYRNKTNYYDNSTRSALFSWTTSC